MKTIFNVPFIDLTCHKNLKPVINQLRLFPDYFEWEFDSLAETREDEDSVEWKERRVCHYWVVLKTSICGVMTRWIESSGNWALDICLTGHSEDMTLYFRKQSNAEALRKTFLEYRLGKLQFNETQEKIETTP